MTTAIEAEYHYLIARAERSGDLKLKALLESSYSTMLERMTQPRV
jgi:hypothetical protein